MFIYHISSISTHQYFVILTHHDYDDFYDQVNDIDSVNHIDHVDHVDYDDHVDHADPVDHIDQDDNQIVIGRWPPWCCLCHTSPLPPSTTYLVAGEQLSMV